MRTDFDRSEAHTQFEEKLQLVAQHVQAYCLKAIWAYLGASVVFRAALVYYSEEDDLFSNDTLLSVTKMLITAIVLLIVSLPEGLPLAVSIAMAFSASEFKKDKIFIRNINNYQRCAMIHDMFITKTGILTHGTLRVTKYHLSDQLK